MELSRPLGFLLLKLATFLVTIEKLSKLNDDSLESFSDTVF